MKPASRSALFGPFRLAFASKRLWNGDAVVPLGGRAVELLMALIERPGEVLTKQELMASAWPGLFVEEANLRVQMTALRRVLGDGVEGRSYIANVARRGYSFVAQVAFEDAYDVEHHPKTSAKQNLPLNLTPVLGREIEVGAIRFDLARHRLVSVVGPGGVGKTTVAIDVARSSLATSTSKHEAVVLVELAQIAEAGLVANSIASAIGVTTGTQPVGLAEALPSGRLLLILDNCEHVAEAAATAVETLLSSNPELRILVTSREPLRARGERVHRLAGLDLPSADEAGSPVVASPAVRLFLDRAAASLGHYEPSQEDLSSIVEICRRLDGLPLAIELAAGRVDTFGVRDLAQRLDDVFHILVAGRRTAMPRHQTLQATLNWSFDNLGPGEQATLSRLAVFSGLFSMDAASAVAAIEEPTWEIVENLSSLVSKSLVTADFSQALPRYRLLEVTRAYAFEKLRGRGEVDRLARRHAANMQKLLGEGERAWPKADPIEWLATYSSEVDNVRAALDWCFGPGGDRQIGAALTISSAVLWFQLSLVMECRARFERALESLHEGAVIDPAREVAMLTSLATALTYTIGPGKEASQALDVAAGLARETGDVELQLRVCWAIWLVALCSGRYSEALAISTDFIGLARTGKAGGDPANEIIGARLNGVSLMFLGRVTEAKAALETALAGSATSNQIVRMQYDQELTARAFYSMTLYLLGEQDAASDLAARNVADARDRGHATTLALNLVDSGLPVAYYCGELDAFAERLDILREVSHRNAFGPWRAWHECYRGSLSFAQGEFAIAADELKNGLATLEKTGWPMRRAMFVSHRAQALVELGRTAEAKSSVDEAIALCQAEDDLWILPELLRVRATIVVPSRPEETSDYLEQSWAMATSLRLRSWALRAATSALASSPSSPEARDRLKRSVAEFPEGREKPDYLLADRLLRSFGAAHEGVGRAT